MALPERGVLVYDGDLTGRPVSHSSTTYPQAALGWMSDAVQLGYQATLVSLHSPTYGRLWLSAKQPPGDTVSVSQAEARVRAAEARTGARPRRRTEWLAQRNAQHKIVHPEAEAKQTRAQTRLERARQRLAPVEQERQRWAQAVTDLAVLYRAWTRPERPHSRLAPARPKLTVRERRLAHRQKDLERARR